MHRSIQGLNKKKKSDGKSGKSDEDSSGEEEDVKPSSAAVRVKFSRPETERQKKRREASALHREKKIASDMWIPMKVHLKDGDPVAEKIDGISQNGLLLDDPEASRMSIRALVNRAIICGVKEELFVFLL